MQSKRNGLADFLVEEGLKQPVFSLYVGQRLYIAISGKKNQYAQLGLASLKFWIRMDYSCYYS